MVADIDHIDLHNIGSQALLTVSGSMDTDGEGFVECKLVIENRILLFPTPRTIP